MNSPLLSALWFLAIVALIPLVLWLLKRSPVGLGRANGPMRLVAALPLSPQQKLLTIEVGQGEDRRWLVLGVTAQQIQTLHVMPPQVEPSTGAPLAAGGFAAQLRQRLGGQAANSPGGPDVA